MGCDHLISSVVVLVAEGPGQGHDFFQKNEIFKKNSNFVHFKKFQAQSNSKLSEMHKKNHVSAKKNWPLGRPFSKKVG